jgi:hypothetical protein
LLDGRVGPIPVSGHFDAVAVAKMRDHGTGDATVAYRPAIASNRHLDPSDLTCDGSERVEDSVLSVRAGAPVTGVFLI